uniref:Uncharacterized protein n=1 Tax=Rhizophagus irregularis (strain DAOM 181602 / DAOM 197198 / MUCL 43194) TaxID=747089 RepID=U9UBS5_RHIID
MPGCVYDLVMRMSQQEAYNNRKLGDIVREQSKYNYSTTEIAMQYTYLEVEKSGNPNGQNYFRKAITTNKRPTDSNF